MKFLSDLQNNILIRRISSLSLILILIAFYLVYISYITLHFKHLVLINGHLWIHGDWLINSTETFVRRGTLGYILIFISDILNYKLLYLTAFVQLLTALVTIVLTIWAVIKIGITQRIVILLTAPGFFIPFWAVDFQGFLRKEVIAYLAFAVFLHGINNGKITKPRLLLSMFIFICAVLFHEGLVFLTPLYMFAVYFSWSGSKKSCIITICIFLVFIFIALLVNILPPTLEEIRLVCDPLIKRGLEQNICSGAIAALTSKFTNEKAVMWGYIINFNYHHFFRAYLLGFLPIIFYVFDGLKTKIIPLAICIASSLLFLPLYYIGADWGRWISMNITTLVYVLLILKAKNYPIEPQKAYPLLGCLVFYICINYSFEHHFVYPINGILPLFMNEHDKLNFLTLNNLYSYLTECIPYR